LAGAQTPGPLPLPLPPPRDDKPNERDARGWRGAPRVLPRERIGGRRLKGRGVGTGGRQQRAASCVSNVQPAASATCSQLRQQRAASCVSRGPPRGGALPAPKVMCSPWQPLLAGSGARTTRLHRLVSLSAACQGGGCPSLTFPPPPAGHVPRVPLRLCPGPGRDPMDHASGSGDRDRDGKGTAGLIACLGFWQDGGSRAGEGGQAEASKAAGRCAGSPSTGHSDARPPCWHSAAACLDPGPTDALLHARIRPQSVIFAPIVYWMVGFQVRAPA
jgi:hypothetical protein